MPAGGETARRGPTDLSRRRPTSELEPAPEASSAARLRRAAPLLAVGLLLAFQLASFDRWLGFGALATAEPLTGDDYPIHQIDAQTVAEFLRRGSWWGYDPTFYAGYTAGLLLSIDNRLFEVAAALDPGLGVARLQKLQVLAFWLLAPLIGWVTARALGFGRGSAAALAALTVLLTECTEIHGLVRVFGMISFAWAILLAPLVWSLWVALLRRWTAWRLVAFAAAAQALVLVHGSAPLLAAPPILLSALAQRRSLDRRRLLQLGVALGALVAFNLTWALPLLRHGEQTEPSGFSSMLLQAGGGRWALDLLLLQKDLLVTGHPFPFVRTLLLGLTLAALVLGARSGARRVFWPSAASAAGLLVLTFGAPLAPWVRDLQPLRFLPAALAFTLPPVAWLAGRAGGPLRASPLAALAAALLLCGLAWRPLLARIADQNFGSRTVRARLGLPAELEQVLALVSRHTDTSARILLEDSDSLSKHRYRGHATVLLPRLAQREFLIGLHPYAPIVQRRITLVEGRLGGRGLQEWPPHELSDYFARYNVGWIVAWSKPSQAALESHPEVQRVDARGGFTLYRVARAPSWFLAGTGRLERDGRRLRLRGLAPGGSIVLAYHWAEGLRTSTGQPILRQAAEGDPIGFIRIDDVPAELDVSF